MSFMGITTRITSPRADLEVQVMQQNHCDGVLSNDWNTLLGEQISQHTAMSMSRSALAVHIAQLYSVATLYMLK